MKTALLTTMVLLGSTALADSYKVDPAASNIAWKAGKKIGSFHDGNVKVKSGTVETDAKGQVKSATIIVDMTTISNNDLKDSPDFQKKLVGHLSSEDFFNVAKHPEAKFELKSLKPKAGSKDEYIAEGTLTMIGTPKPLDSFVVKIKNDKNSLTGETKVTIERLKWGLKYGSSSFFKSLTADKIINDTFDLTLNLVAKK